MKKLFVFCVLLTLWLSLDGSNVWAQIDVGWMQEGVRVWYFGAAGTENAEEAYLFSSINGNTAQLTHHSGINYWSLPRAEAETGSILNQGPFWIHPQVLQTIAVGDNWMGIRIASMNRAAIRRTGKSRPSACVWSSLASIAARCGVARLPTNSSNPRAWSAVAFLSTSVPESPYISKQWPGPR